MSNNTTTTTIYKVYDIDGAFIFESIDANTVEVFFAQEDIDNYTVETVNA